ncbi:AAA family ATPase, partial [Actinosynnema sp. NPDC023926]|uniref:AAA family ATPase n=1 Tax=Actinosynnema sp. NPDC023926 TaxID=3157196 RepID=UPI0033E640B1
MSGSLNPDDLRVSNRHVMAVEGHRPDPDGGSPWGGLSGAALFSGDLLIGVVMADEAGSSHTRLTAVPAYVVHHDEGFLAVLTEHGGGPSGLVSVEFAGLSEAAVPMPAVLPSPAWLLHPELEVVPFRGREEVLAGLREWAAVEGFGACLVHGPGGQGKTRLARQLGRELGARWAVVWLSAHCAEADLAVVADAAVPTLLVVDYAETRSAQVEALLRVAAGHGGGVPLKVLLLARTAGEWWDRLRTASTVVSMLLDGSPVVGLAPLEPDVQGREEAYGEAVRGFRAALPRVRGLQGRSWPDSGAGYAGRDLSGAGLQGALTLHMTALADLLDVDTGFGDGPVASAGEVEDRLLEHEQRYWDSAAEHWGTPLDLTRSTLRDAMAAAVLVGADDRDQADALLRRVAGLADQPRDRRDAVVEWIAGLYPAAGGVPFGVPQPDRLAERFVGRHLHQRVDLADRLASGVAAEQAERLLTVYSRAAGHAVFDGVLDDRLTALCVRHARKLGEAAIEVATQVEYPEPLVAGLTQIGDAPETDLDFLITLYGRLPHFSHRLAEWAARLAERIVQAHRQQVLSDSDAFLANLAASLNNQAIRLADLGRREDALATVTEAVQAHRQLAQARPDAVLPDLATSLMNQAARLAGLGRREDALTTNTEAVEIRRQLAQARPDAFLPDLAASLSNQAAHLAGLGRREDALATVTEAVQAYRQLAQARPDVFLANLATSLMNLAARLADLGRREDALTTNTEAVEIRRQLAQARPDAFLPD